MKGTRCAIDLPQSTSISDLEQTSFVADAPQIRIAVHWSLLSSNCLSVFVLAQVLWQPISGNFGTGNVIRQLSDDRLSNSSFENSSLSRGPSCHLSSFWTLHQCDEPAPSRRSWPATETRRLGFAFQSPHKLA